MRKLLVFFTLLLCSLSTSVWAVDCYQNASGGTTSYTAVLPPFAVPSNAAPGQKIWESSDINITVYCDNAINWTTQNPSEDVFAWVELSAFNSSDILNNPYFTFGVTYNGVDYEGIDVGIDTGMCLDRYEFTSGGYPNKKCNGSTVQKNVTFGARFRLYIKLKAFPANTDDTYDFGLINVLQFDGSEGANTRAGAKNLRYNIDGLNNIRFLDCNVDIKIYPESQNVNFGSIPIGSLLSSAITEPFSVSTIRDATAECSDQFDVTTSFYTDDILYDATHLDMGNGLLLRLIDKTANFDVQYNQYQEFASYSPGDHATVTHEYIAELTKDPAKEVDMGPFSKSMVIKINYH